MHRSLLTHCRALISEHHAHARKTFKRGATAVHEFGGLDELNGDEFDDLEVDPAADPLVVDENELLSKYFKDNNISSHVERVFLEEALHGCARHEKIINVSDFLTMYI
jgi:hypothetical protein